MSLLTLRAVTKSVLLADGAPLHILRGVDLDVEAGEYVSIVGRSGTGKSTLLNILGLLDLPTGGDYWVNGVHVREMGENRRTRARGRGFGFVFQQFNLLPGRNALENATAPLLYASGSKFWNRTQIAREILERV
nr:ATP-binding cassette domain-containing protein [Actinomycetales bacterium]